MEHRLHLAGSVVQADALVAEVAVNLDPGVLDLLHEVGDPHGVTPEARKLADDEDVERRLGGQRCGEELWSDPGAS